MRADVGIGPYNDLLDKLEFVRNKMKKPPIAWRLFLIGIKKRREVEGKRGLRLPPSFQRYYKRCF